ncbi:Molybdopterin synthase catalytic subunit [Dispira parvispora]|uniref:Molybdopterin synthase catalytic subunit n=1 Tax=Dispira parvispora TaxID=1520584 RepID=A0A9W8AVE7_9FUNG|nr:Molybdopterin synthase catalytic subunit [Dispira parvispora]
MTNSTLTIPSTPGECDQGDKTIVELTSESLDCAQILELVRDPTAGAVGTFIGTTRNTFDGKAVISLRYEGYTAMAKKHIQRLVSQARERWQLRHVAVVHKLGDCPAGEISVVIAVSSTHRRDALEAVPFLIDQLKASVPIWKKELLEDGSGHWKANKESVLPQ